MLKLNSYILLVCLLLTACYQNDMDKRYIKIGEDSYTKTQVKKFLQDVYSDDKRPNITIWQPENDVVTYRLIFASSIVPTEELRELGNDIVLDILNIFSELSQIKFENVDNSTADIFFVFSDEFRSLGEYEFVRNISLGSNPTEESIAIYESFWDEVDNTSADGFRTNFNTGQFLVKQGETNFFNLARVLQLGRATEVNSEKFYRIAYRAICNAILAHTGLSSEITNSCFSTKLSSDSQNIYSSIDIALAQTLYGNKQLSRVDKAEAVEEILNILLKKYGKTSK